LSCTLFVRELVGLSERTRTKAREEEEDEQKKGHVARASRLARSLSILPSLRTFKSNGKAHQRKGRIVEFPEYRRKKGEACLAVLLSFTPVAGRLQKSEIQRTSSR